MSARSVTTRLLLAAASLSLGHIAFAQDVQPDDAEPGRAAVAAPEAAPVMPVTPAKPPIHWSKSNLKHLLAAVEAAHDEGLRPSDYQRDALAGIVAEGRTGDDVDPIAEGAVRALAHDYADGRITDRTRFDWHIDHSPAALTSLDADVDAAVEDGRLDRYLASLLPQDPRYAALRDALKATGPKDVKRLASIRASMERWRWMPRTLGEDYVMVNVPAYQLTLFKDDMAVTTHDVVVGARKTPTPMIATYADSIIVNPWWTLPPVVLAEGKRYSPARGYVYSKIGGRTVVRQKPGPENALGRMKINLDNPYAIYLHDTPAQAAFAKPQRALSHGCVRVKDIAGLADDLAEGMDVQTALDGKATQTLQLQKSLPVYIVYFTAGTSDDGRVVTYADPYARDAALNAALDGKTVAATQFAAAAI